MYAPVVTPRAFRWTAIAEHWAALGHKVEVLCAGLPGLPRFELRRGVAVHRRGGSLGAALKMKLPPELPGPARPPARSAAAALPAFGRWLRWARRKTWGKVYWPDYACLWYFSAAAHARKLVGGGRFDAIVSVSDPFTSHLVALQAKKSAPKLTWVADIGDPFTFVSRIPANNQALYQRLNTRLEQAVLDGASGISVTNEAMRSRYEESFPGAASKLRVIPPLIAPHSPSKSSVFAANGAIRLVYAGSLYRKVREPGALLSLFAELLKSEPDGRLELHFFGRINDCGALFDAHRGLIGKRVFLHGLVEPKLAAQALLEADFLVNIGNEASPLQLPSKIVDYAAAGKPIVNLVGGGRDASSDFLASYPACLQLRAERGHHCRESAVRLAAFIRNPPLPPSSELERWATPFRIGPVAELYYGMLGGPAP